VNPPNESTDDVLAWFRGQLDPLLPVGLGSLSLRRSPCVRQNCHVCATGEQHPSHVLYGRVGGRRFAVYVPDDLVPEVRALLDRGRQVQELLYEASRRYVEALKRARQGRGRGR